MTCWGSLPGLPASADCRGRSPGSKDSTPSENSMLGDLAFGDFLGSLSNQLDCHRKHSLETLTRSFLQLSGLQKPSTWSGLSTSPVCPGVPNHREKGDHGCSLAPKAVLER